MDILILTLLIVGLAFMAVESIVPKMGILAVSGTISFVIALFLLKQRGEWFDVQVDEWMLLGISAVGFAVLAATIVYIWRVAQQSLPDPLVGHDARVTEWADGAGRVHIDGDTWNAKSTDPIAVGDTVQITGFDPLAKLTLIVKNTTS